MNKNIQGDFQFCISVPLNSSVERFSLISLGRLFQRKPPCNKSEFITWQVECAGGKCNKSPFLKSYGYGFKDFSK